MVNPPSGMPRARGAIREGQGLWDLHLVARQLARR